MECGDAFAPAVLMIHRMGIMAEHSLTANIGSLYCYSNHMGRLVRQTTSSGVSCLLPEKNPRGITLGARAHFGANSPNTRMSGLFCVTSFRTRGGSRLSAQSALQSVSRFEVSTGDPHPLTLLCGYSFSSSSIKI